MNKTDYSIIVPVYNSVDSLEKIYLGVELLMKELNHSFEVIFVEDNGKEESWVKLLDLQKRFPSTISIIKLTKNFGQNGATLCGIDFANGEKLITIDDDLQINPTEIKKLILHQNSYHSDIVYGIYKNENLGLIKKWGSNFVKSLFLKSEGGSSIGSSFRLINSNITKYLKRHSQDHLFINQIITWYTSDIQYVEIDHNLRPEGNSGYSFLKLVKIGLRLIFFYSSIPLKIMIAVCVIFSVIAFLLAGFYIYKHFVFGEGLGFLVIVSIAISLILASISTIGIYLNRIYSSRVRKPSYAIKLKANAAD